MYDKELTHNSAGNMTHNFIVNMISYYVSPWNAFPSFTCSSDNILRDNDVKRDEIKQLDVQNGSVQM